MSGVSIDPKDYLILVCDDEESIRSLLAEAISSWGFQVATAPNAEAALQYMAGGNLPHIIVTDIRMGGLTGIELAERAKQISSEIEVVIMTSHGTFETAVQAMRIGVYDYLSKPFERIDDVQVVLTHVCERIYLRFYTEYLVNALQKKNFEVENLALLATELSKSLEITKVLDLSCRGLSRAFDQGPCIFFQYHPVQRAVMGTLRSQDELFGKTQPQMLVPGAAATGSAIATYLENIDKDQGFQGMLMQANEMSPGALRVDEYARWKVMPLVTRGIPRGFFIFAPLEWDAEASPLLLERYRQTISTAFENAVLHARVVESSIRDGLTGLFNVRHFKDRMAQEIHQAIRLRHPLSVIFFDVDHFKKYNDTHGHPAGDEVLRRMAEQMRKAFRTTDVLARYGGEEFVVLMPHTAFIDALEKAERFRAAVEEAEFPNEQTQPLGKVTISIGVSEFPSMGSDVAAVIKAADDALYEAKKKSRNVVVPGKPALGYVPAYQSLSVRTKPDLPVKESSKVISIAELQGARKP